MSEYVNASGLEAGTEFWHLGNIVKAATVKEVESTFDFPMEHPYWIEVIADDGFEYRFTPDYVLLLA